MIRNSLLAPALVVLGIVLLVGPAAMPAQQVLTHDTRPGTQANATQLEAEGVTILHYDDLSDRGQELYVQTLRNGGRLTVPVGEGAPDFEYQSSSEADGSQSVRGRFAHMGFVIERPPDADLPTADERVERYRSPRDREQTTDDERQAEMEERRRQIARYDLMVTQIDTPPLDASSNLVRLLSAVVGVLAVGIGGYRNSRP